MFLAFRRPIYRVSHLYYDPQTEKDLQRYMTPNSGPYNLPIKLLPAAKAPTRWNRFFLDKELRERFQNAMDFINFCGNSPVPYNKDDFPNIEDTLKQKISSYMKSRAQKVFIHQCNVGRAFFVEEKKVFGVFFDRKLNLSKSCYSKQFDVKTKDIKFRQRTKLNRSQDLTDLQTAQNLFETGGYSMKYRDTYSGFQQSEFITRSVIKIIADVKIEIQIPSLEESIRLGYEGPTEHMIQIESYSTSYQEEAWAVTDIDFFMQGNYWLKD